MFVDKLGVSCLNEVIKILIVLFLLAGCQSSPQYVPVKQQPQPPSTGLNTHRVALGETLYSIAWRYNLDYKDLARSNGIGSNYRIFSGQLLNLNVRQNPLSTSVAKDVPATKKAAETAVKTSPKNANKPILPSPHGVEAKIKKHARLVQNRSIKTSPTENQPLLTGEQFNASHWHWPAKGELGKKFHANGGLHKGIDIVSELGEPVRAAAAGRVVYSGSGLRGYGNLLIIKHNDRYLSAYAHNSRLLVDEGKFVAMGQKIAEMGSSGSDSVRLYFEIRKDGKPVNPLRLLSGKPS